ncbi:hypothetical protein [Azospirillum oleiclasticum]|uniref:hypothetical protein n=1 Tax=Azospirillum oleiclasticum TaxID=2735135 RepID=UPI001FE2FEEE|nr:hypothetical protein [Azospirillum oleiclasticum]
MREGVSDRYVGHLLPLAFLAPDIVEAIVAGRQPPGLTAESLIKRTDLPLDWDRQREALGFTCPRLPSRITPPAQAFTRAALVRTGTPCPEPAEWPA